MSRCEQDRPRGPAVGDGVGERAAGHQPKHHDFELSRESFQPPQPPCWPVTAWSQGARVKRREVFGTASVWKPHGFNAAGWACAVTSGPKEDVSSHARVNGPWSVFLPVGAGRSDSGGNWGTQGRDHRDMITLRRGLTASRPRPHPIRTGTAAPPGWAENTA